jgi:hypothetical protein
LILILILSIEQKDVVLEAVVPSMLQNNNQEHAFAVGDTVLYVPLWGINSDVGIIEIHGVTTESLSDHTKAERPVEALKAMIAAKDFRFIYTCI